MTTPSDKDQTRPDYDGEGIWYRCRDCGAAHEIDQSADFRSQIADACGAIGSSTAEIYADFGIASPGSRWDLLFETGEMVFTQADGRRSIARCGVVSSWRGENHDWLWSWAHPEAWHSPQMRQIGEDALARGLDEGWDAVTTDRILVNSDEAWHLTSLAAHLSRMPLVYWAQMNDINHWYFALTRPVWMH